MGESRWQKPVYIGTTVLVLIIFVASIKALTSTTLHSDASIFHTAFGQPIAQGRKYAYPRDANTYTLSDAQCKDAFPRLFDEIDRAVKDRKGKKISIGDLNELKPVKGYMRAMIHDQQLFVLADNETVYSRSFAVLLSIHRALLTNPLGSPPLPNAEFVFNIDDKHTPAPVWSLTRRANDTQAWLMPDYGFWSWPETKAGSYSEIIRGALAMEESAADNPTGKRWDWESKHKQIVWRGATMDMPQRLGLLENAKGESWADVKKLDWGNKESMQNDLKSMPEHCQYKFLAHTEGNSYSGRLKYLQNCRSVVVSHPQQWVTHLSHLMDATPGSSIQNYVEVASNFSDIKDAMERLLRDDVEARRIADNSVRTFREKYLAPAAETCYWRRLIREWRHASFEPSLLEPVNNTSSGQGQRLRGLPFETYILERRMDWEPY